MKDIIIMGCPRAGKTTLAEMLRKELSYQVISTDSLIAAFEKNFSQVGIARKEVFREKSKKIVPFLYTYIEKYKRDYPNQNFIIEGSQMMPYHVIQIFNKSKAEFVCLGYPYASWNDLLKNIRENDKFLDNSYSRKLSDKELEKRIKFWIEFSNFLKDESMRYNIPFYETDKDRQGKLNTVCNNIVDNLLEKRERM